MENEEFIFDETLTWDDRLALASNPVTLGSVLETLYDPVDFERRFWNRPWDVSSRERSVKDSHGKTYVALAQNRNTPESVLWKLLTNGVSMVPHLASNPSSPPNLLKRLNQSFPSVCVEELAGNPNTPPKLLGRFAEHSSYYLKNALAGNPSCPVQPLIEFFYERSEVSKIAANTLRLKLLEGDKSILLALAALLDGDEEIVVCNC